MNSKIYNPPASEASRELANLTERKNPHTPVYDVKEFVCLSVINFDPNYFVLRYFIVTRFSVIAIIVTRFSLIANAYFICASFCLYLDYSVAIQELFRFLGIGTKHCPQSKSDLYMSRIGP